MPSGSSNSYNKMALVIVGDMFADDRHKGSELYDESVKSFLSRFSYCIANLESPICQERREHRIVKTGPSIRTSAETVVPVLCGLGIDAVTLANNHIRDYGDYGIAETIKTLNESGIKSVGAGMSLAAAREPLVLQLENGKSLAILNFCENEWSTAESHASGANPLDLIENIRQIRFARSAYSKVICIIHGGHEHCGIPSPRMTKVYRSFVDLGADAVISHHTHHVGAFEIYRSAPIVYGLGNFLFTMRSKSPEWYCGLAAELVVSSDRPIECKLSVILQDQGTFRVSMAPTTSAKKVLDQVAHYSTIVKDPDLHEKEWGSRMLSREDEYLSLLSPTGVFRNRWLNSLVWRSKVYRWIIGRRHAAMLLNLVRCEAHRDALQFILKYRVR